MRLTRRCMSLLRLLRAARWLTTTQIHRRYFGDVTIDACRKRLRKLARHDYLRAYRPNRMTEALFTLGTQGRRVLEQLDGDSVQLERRLPKHLEHFVGINEVRIAAESMEGLSFFFASWQMYKLRWAYPIVPDAVFPVRILILRLSLIAAGRVFVTSYGPRFPSTGGVCLAFRYKQS